MRNQTRKASSTANENTKAGAIRLLRRGRTHAGEAVRGAPPVSVKFPGVVAAVREAERCIWKIGDALIEECGPPGEHGVNTGVLDKLRECARELRLLG